MMKRFLYVYRKFPKTRSIVVLLVFVIWCRWDSKSWSQEFSLGRSQTGPVDGWPLGRFSSKLTLDQIEWNEIGRRIFTRNFN